MKKILSAAAALFVCFALSSCGGADVKDAKETVSLFLGEVKELDGGGALSYCADEFKDTAAAYPDNALSEAALSFPGFMRETAKTEFKEKYFEKAVSSISCADMKEVKKKNGGGVILSVRTEADGISREDITFTDGELREMLTSAYEAAAPEEVIADYAAIKGMTFEELVTKYSQISQDTLTNDIYEALKPQADIFAQAVCDYIFREARFSLERDGDTMKITYIN